MIASLKRLDEPDLCASLQVRVATVSTGPGQQADADSKDALGDPGKDVKALGL